MVWNLRTISILMLVVLSVLPLSGTMCAVACDRAAHPEESGHHHGPAQDARMSPASGGVEIGGPFTRPCDHEAAMQQAATKAERTPIGVSAPAASLVTVDGFAAPPVRRVRPSRGAPPGTTPSTSIPVVLRV